MQYAWEIKVMHIIRLESLKRRSDLGHTGLGGRSMFKHVKILRMG
jgi:hypothetical protein